MHPPDYDQAIAYAINRLRRELPPRLTYHDLWHTQFDVLPAVARMGAINGLPHDDIRLMEVAAAFHDIGFVQTCEGHEAVGVQIARDVLPGFGFGARPIERIAGMILATRLPQSPQTLLEEIVVDADLDVLGRDDFFDRNELLRREMALSGDALSWRQWQEEQLRFLQEHTYFTPVARAMRNEGKRRHIETIKAWLRRDDSQNGSGPPQPAA
jgi:predicted metal-dependent HD superfamily phosphohydrolase